MPPKVKCYTRKNKEDETYVTCNNNVKQETKAKSKSLEEKARERTAKDGIPRIVKDGKILKKKPIKFNVKPKPDPKPEPKMKPKKFKIKLKQVVEKTTDQQLKEIGELMGKYYRGEPVLFTCNNELQVYYYYQILRRNKTDCAMPIYQDNKLVAIDEVSIDPVAQISFDIQQIRRFNDEIVDTYWKCKENNKILCIPFLPNDQHMNMLVFNFHREKLEWYEPHGAVYGGAKLKGSPEHFLGRLAEDCVLELETSIASCPKVPKKEKDKALKEIEKYEKRLDELIGTSKRKKEYRRDLIKYIKAKKDIIDDKEGLQGFDGTQEQKKEKTRIAGMLIKDPQGFCCMWSYLYMDFRLKNPKLEPKALGQLLYDKFSNNLAEGVRNYIRGFTQEVMEQLFKNMNPREFKILTQDSTTGRARHQEYKNSQKKLRAIVLDYIKSKA